MLSSLSKFDRFVLGEIMLVKGTIDADYFRTVFSLGIRGRPGYEEFGDLLAKYCNSTGDEYCYVMALTDLTYAMLKLKFFQQYGVYIIFTIGANY